MSRSEIKCWLIIVLLNFLLFLPRYLMEADTSTFFPDGLSFSEEDWGTRQLFFRRNNYDIFRLSIDLLFIVTLFFLFRKKIRVGIYASFAGVYYLLIFLFLIYYNALNKIYQVTPLLSSDIYLLKLAFYNVGSSKLFLFILIPIVLFILIFLSRRIFKYLFTNLQEIKPGKISRVAFILIWLLYLQGTIRSGMTFTPNHVMQLSGALLSDNIQLSLQAANSKMPLDYKAMEQELKYSDFKLKERPDIYLLLLESYGDVVNRDNEIKTGYLNCIKDCETRLSAKGWHVSSVLSTSMVSGGKSWLAFTSIIYGVKVADQGSYLNLLKNKDAQQYSHFIRYLKEQGYRSYWLNSLPNRKEMTIPWELYTDFYSIDQWIREEDLQYQGERFGYGPSPPDQYSLFFARDVMSENKEQPHLLFFITQNSHTPFHSPDSVVTDWQSLNDVPAQIIRKPDFLRRPDNNAYLKSIRYGMQTMTHFITTDSSREAIYILIGDHQPPVLSAPQSGFETPVHIISKNKRLAMALKEYGFVDGMITADCLTPVRHEGLYSIFLRELSRNYGHDSLNLPAYLPEGLLNVTE